MNASVIFLILAAFVASLNTASLPATRANLVVGGILPGDYLLNRTYLQRYPVANTIQSQDLVFRGNSTTRVHAVFATEVGYTQWASAWIVAGGINQPNVSVRVQSSRGYGYYYSVEIWGRYR